MSKTVLFSTSSIKDTNGEIYEGIKDLLLSLVSDGNSVILLSHNIHNANVTKEQLGDNFDFVVCTTRTKVREVIRSQHNKEVILVGSRDVDLQLAASKKLLLIRPMWSSIQEQKAVIYGLAIKAPIILTKVMKILNNQKAWFYELDVDENTKVLSLTNANTLGNYSDSELVLANGFRKLLKNGDMEYYYTLLLHFISSVLNNQEFIKINIWTIMPSSGVENNQQMWRFKERVRIILGKRQKEPLFIRHTEAPKSRNIKDLDKRLPCDRHFDTIHINPVYRGKLKGKNICVIDDYLTNGTSFETLRNLLLKEGVSKIVFVSLGRYRRTRGIQYLKQDFRLSGDTFSPNYEYELLGSEELTGDYNNEAIDDIRELYDIIHNE